MGGGRGSSGGLRQESHFEQIGKVVSVQRKPVRRHVGEEQWMGLDSIWLQRRKCVRRRVMHISPLFVFLAKRRELGGRAAWYCDGFFYFGVMNWKYRSPQVMSKFPELFSRQGMR